MFTQAMSEPSLQKKLDQIMNAKTDLNDNISGGFLPCHTGKMKLTQSFNWIYKMFNAIHLYEPFATSFGNFQQFPFDHANLSEALAVCMK